MSDSAEVASVVGTWIAAGIAIIALFGVLPPWLLWRNVRSERHLALKTVDDPDHIYVSKGLRVWRNIHAFRRITVPYLLAPPKLEVVTMGTHKLPDSPSRTGWVAFLEILGASKINLPERGDLVFKNGEPWLPVQKLWFLPFGLLGRFGDRHDRGQTRAQEDLNVSRLDHDHLHGHAASGIHPNEVSGHTGILKMPPRRSSSEPDCIYFTPYNRKLRGELIKDDIPITTLFWLLAGCLPVVNSRVFDLCCDLDPEINTLTRVEPASSISRHRDFIIGWKDSSGISQQVNNSLGEQSERLHKQVYNIDGKTAKLWRYRKISNIVSSSHWYTWAEAMGCKVDQIMMMDNFDPLDPSSEASSTVIDAIRLGLHLQDYNMSTWIIFSKPGQETKQFIWRSDLYTLCLAILSLAINPQHFLLHKSRASFGLRLFNAVDPREGVTQLALFNTIKRTFQYWPMRKDAIRSRKFQEMLDDAAALPTTEPGGSSIGFSRRRSECLSQLDNCIQDLTPAKDPTSATVRQIVGILYLSTATFRDFIHKIGLEDPAFVNSSILIDPATSFVRVTFGTADGAPEEETRYRMDYNDVFEEKTLPTKATSVSLQTMMLSCLQAWTRVTWFRHPLDSKPLIRFLKDLPDTVNVCATNQPTKVDTEHYYSSHGLDATQVDDTSEDPDHVSSHVSSASNDSLEVREGEGGPGDDDGLQSWEEEENAEAGYFPKFRGET